MAHVTTRPFPAIYEDLARATHERRQLVLVMRSHADWHTAACDTQHEHYLHGPRLQGISLQAWPSRSWATIAGLARQWIRGLWRRLVRAAQHRDCPNPMSTVRDGAPERLIRL